jgi:hypothetical protein
VVGEDRPQRFIFKFQVSSIGGDNYRIIARDPDHGCGLRDVGDESRTLTVWRKFGIYEDKMQAGDHTDDPDSSRVSGAFRDAFIETEFLDWDYTVHANWLRHLACFEGPLSGETYPESAGAAYFVHQELSSRYPPDHGLNPKDTVQIFGAHILAKERDTTGGSGYRDKAFGSACAGLVLLDYAHSFAALKTIEKARDPDWMEPDWTLDQTCLDFGIVEGNCVKENELRWKVSIHELGHAIGNLTHYEVACTEDIEGEDASIMTYGCLYHNWFDGYFGKEDILQLRRKTPHD